MLYFSFMLFLILYLFLLYLPLTTAWLWLTFILLNNLLLFYTNFVYNICRLISVKFFLFFFIF